MSREQLIIRNQVDSVVLCPVVCNDFIIFLVCSTTNNISTPEPHTVSGRYKYNSL